MRLLRPHLPGPQAERADGGGPGEEVRRGLQVPGRDGAGVVLVTIVLGRRSRKWRLREGGGVPLRRRGREDETGSKFPAGAVVVFAAVAAAVAVVLDGGGGVVFDAVWEEGCFYWIWVSFYTSTKPAANPRFSAILVF